jgi:hypothetical protein
MECVAIALVAMMNSFVSQDVRSLVVVQTAGQQITPLI